MVSPTSLHSIHAPQTRWVLRVHPYYRSVTSVDQSLPAISISQFFPFFFFFFCFWFFLFFGLHVFLCRWIFFSNLFGDFSPPSLPDGGGSFRTFDALSKFTHRRRRRRRHLSSLPPTQLMTMCRRPKSTT